MELSTLNSMLNTLWRCLFHAPKNVALAEGPRGALTAAKRPNLKETNGSHGEGVPSRCSSDAAFD